MLRLIKGPAQAEMQGRVLDMCKKGSLNIWGSGMCVYMCVHAHTCAHACPHSSIPVSKGTALGKGAPHPLFISVCQKLGAGAHIG